MNRTEIQNLLCAAATLQYTTINIDKKILALRTRTSNLGIKRRIKKIEIKKPEKASIITDSFCGILGGFIPAAYVAGGGIGITAVLLLFQVFFVILGFLNDIFFLGYGDAEYTWANFLVKIVYFISYPIRWLVEHFEIELPIGTLHYKHLGVGDGLFSNIILYGIWCIVELSIISIIICFLVSMIISITEKCTYRTRKINYEQAVKEAERKVQFEKEQDEQRVSRENAMKKNLNREITILQEQRCKAETILNEIKSLNVIPGDYFNLEIICNLYRYFRNGNVDTMKEALNKYDLESRLDRIELKLNNILENQNHILEQLKENNRIAAAAYEQGRQLLAQNNQIIHQNNKIVEQNDQSIYLQQKIVSEQKYMSYNLDALKIMKICDQHYA